MTLKPQDINPRLALLFILILTFCAFSYTLQNGFTNWDDGAHVWGNALVRSLSWENIVRIFTSDVQKTYIPLTILSFAVEYHWFGLNPFVYHLTNLILHLAVTGLVFLLALRMGLPVIGAGLAALLFGVHPVHVESVAWVTERKDVLYAFFYMLALISYWAYLTDGRRTSYLYSILFGALSILAKPMALSLPLVLCLFDWLKQRPLRPALVEKIPHLLYVIPLAGITFLLNARVPELSQGNFILIWLWTFSFYLQKLCWPWTLVPLYDLPFPVSFSNPAYFGALATVGILGAVMILLRRDRWFWFAIGFYFLSIFFLLRFDDVKDVSIVADRFMYLPSLGFFFWIGQRAGEFFQSASPRRKQAAAVVLVGVAALLSIKTYGQTKIWENNFSLWDHVVRHSPRQAIAFVNRGESLSDAGAPEAAIADFTRALALDPQLPAAYTNRGNVFAQLGQIDRALADYGEALRIAPNFTGALNSRGVLYARMGNLDGALADFNAAVTMDPQSALAYFNRGNVFWQKNDKDAALADYNRAIQLDSRLAAAYAMRAQIFSGLGQNAQALEDAKTAQALGYPRLETFIAQLEHQ